MSKTHLILAAIVAIGLLALGVKYTLNLRDELTLANQQVKGLNAKIKIQSALSSAMTAVSTIAIQSKQDMANDENQTKQVIRTIIKDSDCANTIVPEPASNRLRQYAERIRDPTPTN